MSRVMIGNMMQRLLMTKYVISIVQNFKYYLLFTEKQLNGMLTNVLEKAKSNRERHFLHTFFRYSLMMKTLFLS